MDGLPAPPGPPKRSQQIRGTTGGARGPPRSTSGWWHAVFESLCCRLATHAQSRGDCVPGEAFVERCIDVLGEHKRHLVCPLCREKQGIETVRRRAEVVARNLAADPLRHDHRHVVDD